MSIQVLEGDCRSVLATLPANSVHCCVCSPPYYGLRQYLPEGHPDMAKQIGLEPTLAEYIAEMVAVFREVRRALRPDGTVWLNIGDSYNAYNGGAGISSSEFEGRRDTARPKLATGHGLQNKALKPKDLMMVPARLAVALQDDGWWVRSDIIWAKESVMPESVTDRPTQAHEHIFLLTKSARYFYDAVAIEEEGAVPAGTRAAKGANVRSELKDVNGRPPEYWNYTGRRNKRNVWRINPKPFADAHFATFPPELPETCIKAGTSERGCCPACGAPWVRVIETSYVKSPVHGAGSVVGRHYETGANGWDGAGLPRLNKVNATTGWQQTCSCAPAEPIPTTVLDPFAGAGTTLLVADRLQRNAIGIELNPEYCAMARERCRRDAPLFAAAD